MSSEIEQEFTSVYKIRQKRAEDRQDYLDRLVEAVNKASDDNWERLTESAQQWFNQAVKAWDVEKPIPDFPDAEPEQEQDESGSEDRESRTAEADDESEEEMATSTKRRAAKKVAAPKKRHTNGASNGTLAVSGSSIIKRALLRNMRATDKELHDALKKKEMKLSPVRLSIVKNEFKHSMKLLQEEGKLRDKYQF